MAPIAAEDWDDTSLNSGAIAVYRFDPVHDKMPLFLWADILMASHPLPCPCCGWNWGKGKDDSLPPDAVDMGPCECETEYNDQLARDYWASMEIKSIERGEQ